MVLKSHVALEWPDLLIRELGSTISIISAMVLIDIDVGGSDTLHHKRRPSFATPFRGFPIRARSKEEKFNRSVPDRLAGRLPREQYEIN
jgi:hypothetical protein